MFSTPSNFLIIKENDESPYGDDGIIIAIDEEDTLKNANKGDINHSKIGFPDFNHKTWKFGYFSYDYKNKLEQLYSANLPFLDVPDHYFLDPGFVIREKKGRREVLKNDYEFDNQYIDDILTAFTSNRASSIPPLSIYARQSRRSYLEQVEKIKGHIQAGDIYELNFCMEFYAEDVHIDPFVIYNRLNKVSKAPFSAFCRFGDLYVISASPERFLKKSGPRLLSQPIKGTRRRGIDTKEDDQLRKELLKDEKERSENVMIVDLVRNDLSRVARKGTVKVDELFGIYSFPQVHQMISTVSCELNPKASFHDIIKATFPMGSMTGAPKVRAMELIDEFENSRRGLYSGAVGYITPEGDFDFSVIIRTILYDSKQHRLSFSVGSAITALSDPEKEYEECLLKAKALIDALNANIVNE
jgi:para-aminobenzoate synthetase component 1